MYQYGLVAAQLSNENTMTESTSEKAWKGALLCIRTAHGGRILHHRAAGGTQISSGFKLAKEMIEKDYPKDEWNIYVFYQGNGDNYQSNNDTSIKLMKELLAQGVNMRND